MSIAGGHGELGEMIATMPFEPDRVLGRLLPEVGRACGMQMSCAYRVDRRPEGDRLDFCYSNGAGPQRRVAELLGSFFERSPPTWGRYDPGRPEPSERNRAVLFFEGEPDLANAYRKYPLLAATAPSLGIAGHDQLRVLICDGPSLLTWLGGFSPEPFAEDQRRRLEEIAGLLRPRLILERQLGDTQARAAALDLAVEAIPAAAFLLDAWGGVVHANAAGRMLADDDPAVAADLRVAVSRGHPRYSVTHVSAKGVPPLHLAVARAPDAGLQARLAVAARRFGLTHRQTEVLACLARGMANKTIADVLGCSVPTVEVHVGQLLNRTAADSRAHLTAIFWSELSS